MDSKELQNILEQHKLYLNCKGGKRADLRNADLRYAELRYADLRNANLRYANLRNADLRGANLRNADLRGADLRGAYLRGADLRGADLDYSCLPLWCGSLKVNMDDKQIIQLLYHILSITKNSEVNEKIKSILLSSELIELANRFHRIEECGKL